MNLDADSDQLHPTNPLRFPDADDEDHPKGDAADADQGPGGPLTQVG